jgi:peptidyl-prolyl cis-trans isomerase SurA
MLATMSTVRLRTILMSAALAGALVTALATTLATSLATTPQAHAASQRLVVVVNDFPITTLDIDQRMRLNQALGATSGNEARQRKAALEDLIDDVIKQAEAKRHNIVPNDQQVAEALERMARNIGTTADGLAERLRPQGVSINTLKQYVRSSLAFNWIASQQYNIQVDVDPGEVDRRLASIANDPQFKPVSVYELLEISLPVEQMDASMDAQLFQARAIEAQQFMQRFESCGKSRAAASGIFNVRISDTIQVPADQLPKEMRQALDEVGAGKLLGPMRSPEGIQIIAFCRRTTVEPPRPTREMVENMLLNEKHQLASQRILRELRRSAYIDYKDTSYTQ